MVSKLEKRRIELGYTQQQVAKATGISVASYSMYENNQRKVPKEKAEKIANYLKTELDELFLPFYFTTCEIEGKVS